jgi:hypothetical protein
MSNLSSMFATSNVAIPDEGPKCIRADLDFSSLDSIDIEGLLATTTGTMSYIQGVFIDNADNLDAVSLLCAITNQRITCPAQSQGYFSLLITNPPRLTVSTTHTADLRVRMFFYNVPIQTMVWGPDGMIVNTGGLTDAELRAASVEVNLIAPTISDFSLILDGTNQEAIAAGNGSGYVAIYNPFANADVTVNLAGGDATLGGVVLAGGGSLTIEQGCANAITVAGTNTQTLQVFGG